MDIHPLVIVGRVFFICLALLIILRVTGRSTLSQLRPIDFITMLLMSETVGPALTAGDDSLWAGILAAFALCVASALTAWASFRSRWFDHILDGEAQVLIKHGRVNEEVLRRRHITDEALRTALHQSGVLSVSEVERAFIEPDGQITMVTKASSTPRST